MLPVTHSGASATHFPVTHHPICNQISLPPRLRASVVVGVIVAKYFEPFRKKVLECSMLAHEIFKNVIPSIFLHYTYFKN